MGLLIEKYIGKTGKRLFLIFCWLFTLIVIAAFADMVAGTFNAYTVKDGVTELAAAAQTNGAAGSISHRIYRICDGFRCSSEEAQP